MTLRDRTMIYVNCDSQMLHCLRAILDICHDKQFSDEQRIALILHSARSAVSVVDSGNFQIDKP
jgi:hypothetical protein